VHHQLIRHLQQGDNTGVAAHGRRCQLRKAGAQVAWQLVVRNTQQYDALLSTLEAQPGATHRCT
jgi:hypothetical protein